ncbi:MAG: hypothetical protein WA045_14235 [Nitrospira sp.]
MTPDELRERWCDIVDALEMNYKRNGGTSFDSDLAIIESLCREMIAEGLERAAVIAGSGGFISDASAEARFGKECAGAIRREAQREKGRI